MIRHVIMWELKDELSPEEKQAAALAVKEGLEGLKGIVPGLLEVSVQAAPMDTSNVDLMLESVVADREALASYAAHPAHVKVLEERIRPVIKSRYCMDFEI